MADVLSIPRQWDAVRAIRELVRSKLPHASEDERQSATMVASELVENAIKYGDATGTSASGSFSFNVQDGVAVIEVRNNLNSYQAFLRLQARIDEMMRSNDRLAFYAQSVANLAQIEVPASGGLGLYRIVGEGAYDLACVWENGIVCMRARRVLGSKEEHNVR